MAAHASIFTLVAITVFTSLMGVASGWSQQCSQTAAMSVIFVCTSTGSALRDMNERDSDVTLGVNTGGLSWKVVENSDDGTQLGNTTRRNSSSPVLERPFFDKRERPHGGQRDLADNPANERIEGKIITDQEKLNGNVTNDTGEEYSNYATPTLDLPSRKTTETLAVAGRYGWWQWNPFRTFFDRKRLMPNDLHCPKVEDFLESEWVLTRGEVAACLLRYVMLRVCELPETTCTACTCEETPTMKSEHGHPIECVPAQCWIQLPYIWTESYVVLPLIIFAVHLIISPVFMLIFSRLMRFRKVSEVVATYLGRKDDVAVFKGFHILMLVMQVVASLVNVTVYCLLNQYEPISFPWVKSGRSFAPNAIVWVQFVLNVQMLVNFVFQWVRHEFDWRWLFSPNSIIDILTAHGLLVKCAMHSPATPPLARNWNVDAVANFLNVARPQMNWQFLRAYRSLSAMIELADLGALSHWTAIQRQLVKSALRFWALVTTFVGISVHFEWIGHDAALTPDEKGIPALGDCATIQSLKDNVACAPFMAGAYFMLSTLASVGFGDYTPETAPGYMFSLFLIMFGVIFFYIEACTLLEVVKEDSNGVRAACPTRTHVVLTGGVMRDFDETVLLPFVQQIFHKSKKEQGQDWPELVMIGPVNAEFTVDQVYEFMLESLDKPMRDLTTFCDADPLTPEGLAQAKVREAATVYILPSTQTDDIALEDEYNIHVALSVKSLTKTPFRVVLFSGKAVQLALTSGLHRGQCCCVNELRTSILAQSTRVRGWHHLMMLMSTHVTASGSGAKEHCHEALFPEEYLPSLANRLGGFCLGKHVAGKEFHEVALSVYRETGALPICMQIEGRIVCYPWKSVVTPNTVLYVLHAKEFTTDPNATRYNSEDTNWKHQLQKERWKKMRLMISDQEKQEDRFREVALKDDTLMSDADLDVMTKKAAEIISGDVDFSLLVILRAHEMLWPMLEMYIRKYRAAATREGGHYPLVVLVQDSPPNDLIEAVNSQGPDDVDRVVFVKGRWNSMEDLIGAGILKCKVLIAFPLSASLSLHSTDDSRMFFFTQIVNQLSMRPECLYLMELGSGMNSGHMLPMRKDIPPPPPGIMAEAAFHPSCVSGQVFVPRMLLALLGISYYSFGVVEVVSALTADGIESDVTEFPTRPEQIRLPMELINRTFAYAVEAFLQRQLGPSPVLCVGLVRETLDAEAVMLKPEKDTLLQQTDLLIVLGDAKWASWADRKGLLCFGGRKQRISEEVQDEAPEAGPPMAGAPEMLPLVKHVFTTERPAEEDEDEEADAFGEVATAAAEVAEDERVDDEEDYISEERQEERQDDRPSDVLYF